MKKIFLAAVVLMAGLVAGIEAGERTPPTKTTPKQSQAPIPTKLTKRQEETIARLKDELSKEKNGCTPMARALDLSDIDPVLVGENVVFDKAWLTGTSVTRQQMAQCVRRADGIYNAAVASIGSRPLYGGIIYVVLAPADHLKGSDSHAGECNVVCFNGGKKEVLSDIVEFARGKSGAIDWGLDASFAKELVRQNDTPQKKR